MRIQIDPPSRFGGESVASPVHLLARRVCLWAALGLLGVLGFAVQPTRAAVTEKWVHRYNSPANGYDEALAVAVDGSGNVVVTGYSDGDYYTAKYAAADGALLWEKRYGSAAIAYAVAVDGSGNVVVTGNAATIDGWDYYTVKYGAADGALLWEKRYNGPDNSDDLANAVAVDGSGNVIVTGASYNSSRNPDYYTVKYASADGALLWEKRYNGPANSDDEANAVAVDGSGNVVVTGTSYNPTNADYYTAKYAAADGALLWEKRYNGPANSTDLARAVAVDGSGNVIVTGTSYGPNNSADDYTAKYAAANGALLWEKRFNRSAGGPAYLVAVAVAVDTSGNVVVTGIATNTSGNHDYYTAKHAAGDGAVLWEQRYNGPANGEDEAYALAVDGGGNVYVTGSSIGSDGSTDYATVKYDAKGNQVWIARYDHASGDDVAYAMALDGSGNVYVTGKSDGDYATIKYMQTAVAGFPIILTEPQTRMVFAGSNVTFTVTAEGDAPLSYQWRFNGLDIAGETNDTLLVTNAQEAQAGEYSVEVSNPVGFTVSPLARLTIVTPPNIISPPRSVNGLVGGDASFRVVAGGTGPLGYQWLYNGGRIAGATNATFLLTDLVTEQAGDYWVEVSNAFASTSSPPAHLTVDPLRITSAPQNTTVFAGDNAEFIVGVSSTVPVSYQWRFNGQAISGATNRALLLTSVQPAQAGYYSVGVTNSSGGANSAEALLTVKPLTITLQPQSQALVAGDSVSFTVSALGHLPLHYQWRFDGHEISGATNSILTLTNVQLSDAGDYVVIVTNGFSSATSAVAQMTVALPGGPLDLWLKRESGIALDLFGITYGQGLFVAVGDSGAILSSSDGVTWTNQSVATSNAFHGVTYGNGTFVAVGKLGLILTSPDGVIWTSRASGTDHYLKGVAYGNGVYVAVGSGGGTILSSSNGLTWTVRVLSAEDLNGITFGNGLFLAVGNGALGGESLILTSTNGEMWDFPSSGTGKNLRGAAYGNDRFVIVGNDGTILNSLEGADWTNSAMGCLSTNNLRGITYANGAFAAVGNFGAIRTSAEGAIWTCRSSGTTNNLHSVAYGHGTFVAVGNSATIVQSESFSPGRLAVRGRSNSDGFELAVTGEIGRTYRVQASTNLATTNWIDLFTLENMAGTTVFLDSAAGSSSQRFYRLISP